MLTSERARALLDYDPVSGAISWRVSRRGVRPGVCGRVSTKHGYHEVCVDGRLYRVHRLAFLLMNGAFPDAPHIDHINGDKLDNRWSNLRPATNSENAANSKLRKNNTTSHQGVVWDAARGKWRAQIRIGGRKVNLGRYTNAADAADAHRAAAIAHYGEFAPPHVVYAD